MVLTLPLLYGLLNVLMVRYSDDRDRTTENRNTEGRPYGSSYKVLSRRYRAPTVKQYLSAIRMRCGACTAWWFARSRAQPSAVCPERR
jgi:hypothetical protein